MGDWINIFSFIGSAFAVPERSHDPTRNSLSRKLVVQGLCNVGNSCYLNAVLQGLACLEPFPAYLESLCQSYCKGKLVNSLLKTLKDIAHPVSKLPIVPDITRNALVRKYFLSNMEQQDSAEFLTHLFGWIDEEISSAVRIQSTKSTWSLASLSMNDHPESENGSQSQNIISKPTAMVSPKDSDENTIKENDITNVKKKYNTTSVFEKHSLFTGNPFCGLLESSVRCCVCGYVSTTYSEFLELSLPIISESVRTYHSIDQCMNEFTEPEEVTWKCEECAHAHEDNQWQTLAIKQLTIARHPKLLCIRLHRIIHQGIKLDHPVRFFNDLDTFPYSSYKKGTFATPHTQPTSTSDIFSILPRSRTSGLFPVNNHPTKNFFSYPTYKQISYTLAAVICHYGSANSGHYVIFKKLNFEPDSNGFHDGTEKFRSDWVRISDATSEFVQEKRVLEEKPYLLFYERSLDDL